MERKLDIGSIVADANYITEKALLPLSMVKTEKDKTRYQKKAICRGILTANGKKHIPLSRQIKYTISTASMSELSIMTRSIWCILRWDSMAPKSCIQATIKTMKKTF